MSGPRIEDAGPDAWRAEIEKAKEVSGNENSVVGGGAGVGHLHTIDFLRGFASLGVVICHASEAATFETANGSIAWANGILLYGKLGVPLFFVISGFCIHRKQAERSAAGMDDSIEFLKYWKRRFHRLYPSYFTVCVFSALLIAGAIVLEVPSAIVGAYPGNPYTYLAMDFLVHIVLLHSFFPLFDRGLGNLPLWTLAREEQYYLLYFPLLKLRKYVGIGACLVLAVVASYGAFLASRWAEVHYPTYALVILTSSVSYWPQWVLGMVGMEMLVRRGRSIAMCGHRGVVIAGLALIVLQAELDLSYWVRILMGGAGFFLVVCSLTKIESDGRWVRSKLVRTMEDVGRYSYSLYLVHYPIVIILGKLGRVLGSNASPIRYAIFLAIAIAVCNAAGYLLYLLVERHGQTKPAGS